MTNPGVQKPHWKLCESHIACCSGPSPPSGASPSIVVTSLPAAWTASIRHERTGSPEARKTLADFLRDDLDLTGTHEVGQRLARLRRPGARRAVDPHGDIRHLSL